MNSFHYQSIDFQSAIQLVETKLRNYHPQHIQGEGVKNSAVMILFINKQNIPHLIFTKRTEWVETHKGQISFPGGMRDAVDVDLFQTARRETFEEIGIRPEQIQLLGQLDDFYTVTNFIISPFVGFLANDFLYQINEREVAKVLEVPLSLFLRSDRFEVKKWPYQNKLYDVYFYHYQQEVIWGATAFILNRFIDRVFQYNPAPNPISPESRPI
jgi:8-oxo-dGTP pyrophosphatase MutT (NUDIX family)